MSQTPTYSLYNAEVEFGGTGRFPIPMPPSLCPTQLVDVKTVCEIITVYINGTHQRQVLWGCTDPRNELQDPPDYGLIIAILVVAVSISTTALLSLGLAWWCRRRPTTAPDGDTPPGGNSAK